MSSRCLYCHSVITADEDHCYMCGASMPKLTKAAVKHRPVSALTNTVFLASLAFTAYCFFVERNLSLPVTLAISSALLLIRIVAEQLANRKSN